MSETQDRAAAHREGWALMAWVVGGSATQGQRQTFDAHVRDCAACREEYEFQCRVRDALAEGWPEPADPGPAWARLSLQLDARGQGDASDEGEETCEADRRTAAARHPATRGIAGRGLPPALWWRGLVAAVIVQAVGLAALGSALWARDGRDAAYRTLSSAPADPAATVRLVPAPSLRLADLQALLARHHLVIVESAADGGHFGLAPAGAGPNGSNPGLAPPGSLQGSPAGLDRLLSELRSERGVLMAEPIGTAP